TKLQHVVSDEEQQDMIHQRMFIIKGQTPHYFYLKNLFPNYNQRHFLSPAKHNLIRLVPTR
ncbi:hypothetical protein, partial [Serratia marcescens]|uniref:hypothetical protein n=1 Tax=Serratia marcescens TaxID=615 RepID=UPI001C96EE2F